MGNSYVTTMAWFENPASAVSTNQRHKIIKCLKIQMSTIITTTKCFVY